MNKLLSVSRDSYEQPFTCFSLFLTNEPSAVSSTNNPVAVSYSRRSSGLLLVFSSEQAFSCFSLFLVNMPVSASESVNKLLAVSHEQRLAACFVFLFCFVLSF